MIVNVLILIHAAFSLIAIGARTRVSAASAAQSYEHNRPIGRGGRAPRRAWGGPVDVGKDKIHEN